MFIDYLEETLGDSKGAGEETRFCCPLCGDTKYRLYVHNGALDDPKNGIWHCFHCGASGRPLSFVMEHNNVSFHKAQDILALYGYTDSYKFTDNSQMTVEEELLTVLTPKEKEQQSSILDELDSLTMPVLPTNFKLLRSSYSEPQAYPFFQYLYNRGFTDYDIYMHNIGFIGSEGGSFYTSKGKCITLYNHVVFITHNNLGIPIYWNTRSITNKGIKSINAPGSEGTYTKTTAVFNLNIAKKLPEIVITEGVPDALTLGSGGIATFGKSVSDTQVKLITKDLNENQRLYIMLDEDAKGQAYRLGKRLSVFHDNTWVVINSTLQDANSLGATRAWDIIHKHSFHFSDYGGIMRLI